MNIMRERYSNRNAANIFVGREKELSDLIGRYEQATAILQEDNLDQYMPICLTAIKGTEGIGKSTLFRLMVDYLKKDDPSTLFLSGYASKDHTSFLALWRTLVNNLLGQVVKAETATTMEAIDALFETLQAGNYGDDEYWRLANGNRRGLENLLGATDNSNATDDRKSIFYEIMIALTTLIQTVALKFNRENNRPLVIYLDDCQWADEQSITMLETVMVALNSVNRKLTSHRISLFVVLTCQPQFQIPGRVIGNSSFSEITLGSLSDQAMKDLITRLSDRGTLTPEIQEQLLLSGKGNPLYITEWINLNHEQKKKGIQPTQESRKAPDVLSEVPLSLNKIISDRLSAQSNTARKFLQIVSLCGSNASSSLVHSVALRVMEHDLPQLKELTDELCKSGWLITGSENNETILNFSNSLSLEICSESVVRQERQQLHKVIAEIAEDLYQNETGREEYIASHYEKAGDNAQALNFYLKADQADKLRLFNSQKMNLYEKILILFNQKSDLSREEAAEVITYRIRRAACLKNSDNEIGELHEILESAHNESFPELQVVIQIRLGNLFRDKHNFDQALTALLDASKITFSCDLKKYSTRVLLSLAHVYSDQNNQAKAMEYYRELESDLASLDQIETENLYQGISVIKIQNGLLNEAEEYIRKAINTFPAEEKRESAINLYNILGLVNYYKGQILEAEHCWNKSLELAEIFGAEDMMYQALGNIAMIKHSNENYDEALQLFQRTLEYGMRQNMHDYIANSYASIGDVYMKKGDYALAWENFRLQLQLATDDQSKRQQFLAYLNFSQLSMLKNNLIVCADFLKKAEELGKEYAVNHASDILLLKAELAYKNQEYPAARALLLQTKKAAADFTRDDVLLDAEIIALHLDRSTCEPELFKQKIGSYEDFLKKLKKKGDQVRMKHALALCYLDFDPQIAKTLFKELAPDAENLYQSSGRKIYQDIALEAGKQ